MGYDLPAPELISRSKERRVRGDDFRAGKTAALQICLLSLHEGEDFHSRILFFDLHAGFSGVFFVTEKFTL